LDLWRAAVFMFICTEFASLLNIFLRVPLQRIVNNVPCKLTSPACIVYCNYTSLYVTVGRCGFVTFGEEWIGKEMAVTWWDILSQPLPGGTEKNLESLSQVLLPSRLKIRPLDFRVLQFRCPVTVVDPVEKIGTLKPTRFNIQQFYVLPTQCVYVFCVDLRTNSDYFPIQH
jgi:hypothetical protein